MTYAKVDDKFCEHPKVLDIGPLAEALWLRGLLYASRNTTDGFVPEGFVRRMADLPSGLDEANRLLEAGLWTQEPDGYHIHDYGEWQRSRAEIEAISEARAEAGRRGGVASGMSRREANEAKSKQLLRSKRSKTKPDTESDTDTENRVNAISVANSAETATATPDEDAGKPAKRVRYTAEFEEFWTLYPKGRGDKKPTFDQWRRLSPEDRVAALEGLRVWLESDRWARGIIIAAERFLSKRRWESDPPPPDVEVSPNGRAPDPAMGAWLRVVGEIEYRAEHGKWREDVTLPKPVVDAVMAIGGRNNLDPANEFQRRDFLAAYRAAVAQPEED